ncbi:MAG: NAD(P)H-dependent oxidoreductase, partial [Saprospiraceae bacterium]|nr:NAD(P)H-dependent oxidoreductase [Saprospiraceae bacterium]
MKKILALAGSNSSKSINYQLLNYTVSLIHNCEINVLDIRNWIIPIYSVDMDGDKFTPKEINSLMSLAGEFDGFIISTPEHNSGPTAFFKNITDWLSRRSDKVFMDKPVLLMSASPGRRGG